MDMDELLFYFLVLMGAVFFMAFITLVIFAKGVRSHMNKGKSFWYSVYLTKEDMK